MSENLLQEIKIEEKSLNDGTEVVFVPLPAPDEKPAQDIPFTYLEELNGIITDLINCHETANFLDMNDTRYFKHEYKLKAELQPIEERLKKYIKRITNHAWNIKHPNKQIT